MFCVWSTYVLIRSRFQVGLDHLQFPSLSFPLERSIHIITGFRTLFGESRGTPWRHSCSNLLQLPRTLGRSQREAFDWSETGREAGRACFAKDRIANRVANNECVLLQQIRAGVIWQEHAMVISHILLREKALRHGTINLVISIIELSQNFRKIKSDKKFIQVTDICFYVDI